MDFSQLFPIWFPWFELMGVVGLVYYLLRWGHLVLGKELKQVQAREEQIHKQLESERKMWSARYSNALNQGTKGYRVCNSNQCGSVNIRKANFCRRCGKGLN